MTAAHSILPLYPVKRTGVFWRCYITMKRSTKILWGVALVAIGVLYGLKALNLIAFTLFFDGWWTLFLIVPCLIGLITEREKLGNLIGLLLGVLLLLCCQDVLSFDLLWKLAIPVVIVLIGLRLIIGNGFGRKMQPAYAGPTPEGNRVRSAYAAFCGSELRCDGEVFEGAELTAVFGGVQCDLRGALIEKDCMIHVSATFGGIDIQLPPSVNVQIHSDSLFGGISDKTHRTTLPGVPTVYVNGTCLFGGVNIQ